MSSRIVAENALSLTNIVTPPYFDLMELDDLTRRPSAGDMPTLGQLLKHVGDVRKESSGDGSETPVHHALDIPGIEPRSLPFVLSFSNLTYSIKSRRKMSLSSIFPRRSNRLGAVAEAPTVGESMFTRTKTLLNDISGEARDGEIMAVLGASGSGKSTLIDALANRIAKGSLKGTVALNGEALESRLLKVISAYVMQDDLLFPMLTVEETLMFAAEFRLPRTLSKSKKSARVQALIDQLGLRNAAKTVIGDEGHRGVSGGERRRVTEFALDLIRELEGSPGGTKSLVEFNKSWQSMTKHHQEKEEERNGLSLKEAISASISRGKLVSGASNTNPNPSSMVPTFANQFWVEMATLSKRSFLNSRRMPELIGIRLGTVMVTGFILATMFWQLDNSPKGVQERLGFFAFAMSTTFYTTADALPVFLQERYIFMRETAYNAYRRLSYLVSHALVALPALAFLSLAFAAATFWAVGLDGGISGFLFYFLIIFASFWAGNSFVTFLSGVVPHVMLGYTIVVAILAYFLLFSGFFINRDRIPSYWIWFHYLSLVKYPYEAVLQNEFDDPVKCFVRGVQIFDNTPLGSVPEPLKVKLLETMSSTLGTKITTSTCLTTGADILQQNGVTDLTKWNCFWITVAWGFFFSLQYKHIKAAYFLLLS
ncbi:hypothetical protein JHK86_057162 [Glycine max]|nr:hypothetical protein JHK86_057162 [Glycine max]